MVFLFSHQNGSAYLLSFLLFSLVFTHFLHLYVKFTRVDSVSVIEESYEYLDALVWRVTRVNVLMPYAAIIDRMVVSLVCVSIKYLMLKIMLFYIKIVATK